MSEAAAAQSGEIKVDWEKVSTADLLDELEIRIGDPAVDAFIAREAPACEEEHLDDCDSEDLIEELANRDHPMARAFFDARAQSAPPLDLEAIAGFSVADDPDAASATADARAWSALLGAAARGADRGSHIPILSCVRIAWDGEALTAAGTDLDVFIEARALCDCTAPPWAFCVGADDILALMKTLGGPVTIAAVADRVRVSWRGGEALLPMRSGTDFPDPPSSGGDYGPAHPADAVLAAIARVAPAMSDEETRYYLNGACVHPDGWVVATNGRVLLAQPAPIITDRAAILPRAVVPFLSHLYDAAVQIAPNAWRFSDGRLRITAKLVDGAFPEWRKVVPKTDAASVVTADRAALLDCIRKAAALAYDHRSRGVRLTFDDDMASASPMTARSAEGLSAHVTLPASGSAAFAVDSDYCETILKALTGDTVTVHVTPNEGPILFSGADAFIAVVMPLRA